MADRTLDAVEADVARIDDHFFRLDRDTRYRAERLEEEIDSYLMETRLRVSNMQRRRLKGELVRGTLAGIDDDSSKCGMQTVSVRFSV